MKIGRSIRITHLGFGLLLCACRGEPEAAPAGARAGVEVTAADWCAGHGLPESRCTKCNPSLVAAFKASGDWCEEHGFPESVCPTCNPMQPPPGVAEHAEHGHAEHGHAEHGHAEHEDAGHEDAASGDAADADEAVERRTVRFRSAQLETVAGIETVAARRSEATASIECTAKITFDSDRVADVRAIVPGIVRKIRAELGANVQGGTPLFELESTRVGEIQGTLVAARERVKTAEADVARQEALRNGGIGSERKLELAKQELARAQAQAGTAEAALRMAGAGRGAAAGRYTLSAPISGTLVHRPAVLGVLATESTSLATIAETSVMWALCEVPEADAAALALGQTAHVIPTGSEAPLSGSVTWISAEVHPRTRTVTARAEVPNPDGKLRANQFARARIEVGASRTAVAVPRAAVQRLGEREVVFVRAQAGVYEPRVVRRHGIGDIVQVEGNIRVGDEVVTTGAVLLRTELMPGSIGAGCCEVAPPGKD